MLKITDVGYHTPGANYERVHFRRGISQYCLLYFHSPAYVTFDTEIASASPDELILLTPQGEQDFSAIREFDLSYICFTADENEIEDFIIPAKTVLRPGNCEAILAAIEELHREFFTKEAWYESAMDAKLRNLLISLSRNFLENEKNRETNSELYRLFCQARFLILSNCDRQWNSDNMGEIVSLKKSRFYQYYTRFFHISPICDLNLARIEKAKRLLLNSEINISEVAARCGFTGLHHFSRAFKEQTKMSPSQYVKSVTTRPQ